jgi:hypothetical protein
MVVGPSVISLGSGVGCAVVAFWLVARHPGLGPHTLRGCLAAVAGAFGLLIFLRPAMELVLGYAGPAAALLTVADPIFAFAFWSGALLIRAVAGRAAHGNT